MTPEISGFHAHVYYDADTMAQARALCEAARDRFALAMGRMHERPVGPHPDWSCQLSVPPEKFLDVIPWLALNRDGLTVFVHPLTGDDLIDHRDGAMWMGAVRPLDLSMFGGA
jgi:aromatic ring-cleaving dioxygenase